MNRSIAAVFALVAFSSPAFSQVCDFAPKVLACYHPTASLAGCQQYPNGEVTILFNGGITGRPYQMDIAPEYANGLIRLHLIGDNAIIPPNPNCELNGWQPLIYRR